MIPNEPNDLTLGVAAGIIGPSFPEGRWPMSDISGTNRRLRTPAAAAYIGLAASTLEKMRCRGDGPEFERAGARIVVYSLTSLEAFLAQRRARSTSEPTAA